jgi:hypothetical protein
VRFTPEYPGEDVYTMVKIYFVWIASMFFFLSHKYILGLGFCHSYTVHIHECLYIKEAPIHFWSSAWGCSGLDIFQNGFLPFISFSEASVRLRCQSATNRRVLWVVSSTWFQVSVLNFLASWLASYTPLPLLQVLVLPRFICECMVP